MNNNQNISINFIKQIKQQIISSRYIVAKIANAESLRLYFTIGKMVDSEVNKHNWGSKVLEDISKRLQQELPGLRGFSGQNIYKMKLFFSAWNQEKTILSTLSREIGNNDEQIFSSMSRRTENRNIEAFFSVSFSHHFEIITSIKDENHRWYYINKAANEYWTVRHLRTELKNKSHLHEQKLPNNFTKTLSETVSNKAIQVFKDQYMLDFVNVEDADEEIDKRVLESEIVQNIKKFMMSLGSDFSFMGNQYRINVDGDEYYIDLLFYHRGLQSLVAFDLKKGKFKPEYVGKMNFYLSALDDLVKQPHENPSIGIVLCKEKNDKIVEYSFRDFNKPMGVSVFKTTQKLPSKFKNALPSAEELKNLLD